MQARYDEALAGYRKAALNGYREVANALVTIQVQRQVGVTARLICPAPVTTPGLPAISRFSTADQDLFQQQLLLAQVRGAGRNYAELYRALGGGWQP